MSKRPKRLELAGNRRAAVALMLGLLSFLVLILCRAIESAGAVDIDEINFGLAALRFDVLEHQPHPPGYPGYVVYLKVVHLVAPWLEPLDIAKWGSRLCAMATVPVTFWACRVVLGGAGDDARDDAGEPPLARPLFAALFATLHPVLWYYGAEGQSHAAEALCTIALFGAAASARRRGTLGAAVVAVVALGLAGSIRPTIPVLCSPLALWVVWGRRPRDWLVVAAAGALAVAAWYLPLIAATGGWDVYRRAERALVFSLFIDTHSVFGSRADSMFVRINIDMAIYSVVFCSIPLLAAGRRGGPWRRAALAIAAANALFFALVFIAEAGYMSGLAALSCLVPATWPASFGRGTAARAAAVIACGALFLLAAPRQLPALLGDGSVGTPTLARIAAIEATEREFVEPHCAAAAGEPALVISDAHHAVGFMRAMPLRCNNVTAAHWAHDTIYLPGADNWMITKARSMRSLPTAIPWELGPGAELTVDPVARVILATTASRALGIALARGAKCSPLAETVEVVGNQWRPRPGVPVVWPARCVPVVAVGANVLRVPALAPERP